MQKTQSRLTVYFENPFWVGVYERLEGGKLEASRIVFGPEPRDFQVYQYFLENWRCLRFGPPVDGGNDHSGRKNPKRVQREIARSQMASGTGTKSQQSLQLLREQGKEDRKAQGRQRRHADRQRQFQIRRQKKKQRRSGH